MTLSKAIPNSGMDSLITLMVLAPTFLVKVFLCNTDILNRKDWKVVVCKSHYYTDLAFQIDQDFPLEFSSSIQSPFCSDFLYIGLIVFEYQSLDKKISMLNGYLYFIPPLLQQFLLQWFHNVRRLMVCRASRGHLHVRIWLRRTSSAATSSCRCHSKFWCLGFWFNDVSRKISTPLGIWYRDETRYIQGLPMVDQVRTVSLIGWSPPILHREDMIYRLWITHSSCSQKQQVTEPFNRDFFLATRRWYWSHEHERI